VHERHVGGAARSLRRWLESEAAHLRGQGLHAGTGPGALAGFLAPRPADLGGFVAVGADSFGQRGEQPGEQRVARGIEAEAGGTGGQRVDVTGPADRCLRSVCRCRATLNG